ncbi:hypothetical protein Tco_1302075 [Tanacetum coccineum]
MMDDAIFLGQWNDSNIDTLVHVMECFYRVSGLRDKFVQKQDYGIHVDADRIKSSASKLGCLILNTPFLYLGTKVGENMSRVHAWKEFARENIVLVECGYVDVFSYEEWLHLVGISMASGNLNSGGVRRHLLLFMVVSLDVP